MPKYILYYAGMAQDLENEQIGAAVSEDGVCFERVGKDGLIIARDPAVAWKSLRVCNPTVLQRGGEFVMFYQGITRSGHHNTSLGVARSRDGIQWECDANPMLDPDAMRAVDPAFAGTGRSAVFEPSVLWDGRRYRMWFVYMNESHPGHALWYAESEDAQQWSLGKKALLTGSTFGHFNLHYPQVVDRSGALELWFTLKNKDNGVYGIFRMRSSDGLAWSDLAQILPASDHPPFLFPKRFFGSGLGRLKGIGFLNYRFALHVAPRDNGFFGAAHPHVLPDEPARLYYHGTHAGRRALWHDCRVREDGAERTLDRQILAPAERLAAWDSYFVADPYVLRLSNGDQ